MPTINKLKRMLSADSITTNIYAAIQAVDYNYALFMLPSLLLLKIWAVQMAMNQQENT